MRQFWLAKKTNKKVALKLIADKENKEINFRIVQGKEIDFDPEVGTVKRASVLCPICNGAIKDKTVRKEAQEGRMRQRLVAVVLHHPKEKGKTYRLAMEKDLEIFNEAEKYLEKKRKELFEGWGFDPVPDEPLPPKDTLGFRVQRYGILKWGDLFNPRQKLTLITFMEKVRQAYEKMLAEGMEKEYARVVVSYLALGVNRLATYLVVLTRWKPDVLSFERAFDRQALPMLWDYGEVGPFSDARGQWDLEPMLEAVKHISTIFTPAIITQSSATSLPYPDNHFDAVITDPPYYDNVPYSYLSDFFYVWLKRTIGDLYPELFATPLTPKAEEIVAYSHGEGGFEGGKKFFEDMIAKAFREIHRVLKSEGIACIVFAHKSLEAWETIINALLKSDLVLTASWPLHTEMKARLRAQESGAMASSIYMVCKKRTKEEVAYFNEIRDEIQNEVRNRLAEFWNEGIVGADFFISAIGPGVAVFGKYKKVIKLSGEEVPVSELLEFIRKTVSEFALHRILKNGNLGGIDNGTRFYLIWRWAYNSGKVHFDEARKLGQAIGVEITESWGKGGFIKKDKEFISIPGPKERERDRDFMERKGLHSMIDILHRALICWEKGDKGGIKELLSMNGYIDNEVFWQLAQAISEVLPEGDKERQLLQGFLYGKETYKKTETPSGRQEEFGFKKEIKA